jgi:beta-1,4-mannosyl-glycoprotein beta-1,4-N-acetylglucosaminyltransferase
MKIIDTFLFCYELDLLEIRLNLLNSYVDYFVISESEQTHSGLRKKLFYQENKDKFEKFNHKILYNVIKEPNKEDLNIVSNLYDISHNRCYQQDAYEKDSIKKQLEKICEDDDIIIWSDLDEVPNPQVLESINSFYKDDVVYNFAQENCQGYLNWVETTGTLPSQTKDFNYETIPKWIGTKMFSYKILKKYTMTQMRRELSNEKNFRIYPGGWHWSTVGSPGNLTYEERVYKKIKTTSHSNELMVDNLMDTIKKRISENKNPLGQDYALYNTIPFDDENYPKYLLDNKHKYEYLIKK